MAFVNGGGSVASDIKTDNFMKPTPGAERMKPGMETFRAGVESVTDAKARSRDASLPGTPAYRGRGDVTTGKDFRNFTRSSTCMSAKVK